MPRSKSTSGLFLSSAQWWKRNYHRVFRGAKRNELGTTNGENASMYVRRKRIKGHTYYYLVKSERRGKKVVQKFIRYLGKVGEEWQTFFGRAVDGIPEELHP